MNTADLQHHPVNQLLFPEEFSLSYKNSLTTCLPPVCSALVPSNVSCRLSAQNGLRPETIAFLTCIPCGASMSASSIIDGNFFKLLLCIEVCLYMSRTWSDLPPCMTVKHSIYIIQGYLFTCCFAYYRVQLFCCDHFPFCRTFKKQP